MRVIRVHSYEELSKQAANILAAQVILNPHSVLGLATGSTPLGAYERLVALYEAGELDFSSVVTYNLDEYRGIAHDNVNSYHYFMNEHLFSKVNIDLTNTHVPDGFNACAEDVCRAYDVSIEGAGGCDLQLLGLGRNGHIGFNEPDEAFIPATHCVTLAQSTIEANSRLFDSIDEVPREAYTMGIRTIMSARRLLMLADGTKKAHAVQAMLEGPVTPRVPASILQLHPDCIVIADDDALSLCKQSW